MKNWNYDKRLQILNLNVKRMLFVVLTLTVEACYAQTAKLTLHITNFSNRKGQVLIAIYKNASGFPDNPTIALFRKNVEITGHSTIVDFQSLPYGKYAAVALHDENSNTKLDANMIGYPKEGVAVSNGFKSSLRKPKFAESSFELSDHKTVRLEMNYY